ncbi:MAG: FAD-binding protein, partial [Chloroflexota bacterium]|nr:FAD-binding protein [Chloroflexota bacterium]
AADAGARVSVLTAGDLLSGSSNLAQGGVAAAVGEEDSPDLQARDTLAVGGGLNDLDAVNILASEGQEAVLQLLKLGVPFDGTPERPELGLEAGHSRRRVLHAGGGATGRVLATSLLERAETHPRVTLVPRTPVRELIRDGGRVAGAGSGERSFGGRAVVLATGGYAALWRRTTNEEGNKGSGLMLAWQAGASLADLEFVQFHPTALDAPGRPAFLLSEALRGEGAQVVNASGEPVVDPLLPRDCLARAILRYRRDRGPVFLSLQHLDAEFVRRRFSALADELFSWEFDIARDLLPTSPAAHYCMGGIRTDSSGRSDLPGLYAAGEVACSGVHGANRLASNSLLECLVFGRRAALAALEDKDERCSAWQLDPLPEEPAGWPSDSMWRPAGDELDRFVGVERSSVQLAKLLGLRPGGRAPRFETASLPELVAMAALIRRESRGSHFRTDAPEPNGRWRGRIQWRRGEAPHFEPAGG